jgi:branched-subunit amino acid transport protein AzlD
MSFKHQIITVLVIILATVIMRFLPFILFPDNKPTPKFIHYLGTVLPAAVFGLLMVYALKNVSILQGSHGIPELIGVLCAGILHWIWRNSFISIGVATVLYMVLIRII